MQKNFLVPGENSAGGTLASVLRKHSTEGRTPDAVERCGQALCGVSPSKGDRDLPPRFRTIQVCPKSAARKHSQALALSKPHISRHWRQKTFPGSVENGRAVLTLHCLTAPLRSAGALHSSPQPRAFVLLAAAADKRAFCYTRACSRSPISALAPLCHLRATAPDRRRALELPASWRGRALSRHCPAVKREAEEEWGKER